MGATPGPQGIVGNLSNTLQASTTRWNVAQSSLKKQFRPEMDLLGLQNLDKHECGCHCIELLLEQICTHFLQ